MNNQLAVRDNQIRAEMLNHSKQIKALIGDEESSKKFMAASFSVFSNKNLMKCSPESLVQVCVGVAMSGLSIDPNIGHCYIVPYGNTAQLQIGYKGFIQLLYRAGWMVNADPVYYCDEFTFEVNKRGRDFLLKPAFSQRDEASPEWVFENLRGVVVSAQNKDGMEVIDFIPSEIINKLRMLSPQQKNASMPAGIWKTWFVEMAIAKAIKRVSKKMPIGDQGILATIKRDDQIDTGEPVSYSETQKQMDETGLISTVSEVDTAFEDAKEDIADAKTTGELDTLANGFAEFSNEDKSELRALWMSRKNELKPVANNVLSQIESASSIAELDNLDLSPELEMKYDDLINARYEELENEGS